MKTLLNILFIGLISLSVNAQKEELTLSNAVLNQYGAYYPSRTIMFKWIPNSSDYAYLSPNYQTLIKGNVNNNETEELINTDDLEKITGFKPRYVNVIKWNNSNQFYTLIDYKYYLINIAAKTGQNVGRTFENTKNQDVNFNSNKIAFTIDNNLYVSNKQLTQSMITDNSEEIVSGHAIARSEFGITKGTFWSPSGHSLAFYQKDESNVDNYPLLNINDTPGSLNSIKYPMAGKKSEKSKVGIYDSRSGKTIYIIPTGAEDDYLTNVSWSEDDAFLFIAEVNRDQNHTKLLKYNAKTGALVKIILEEKNDKWTEPENPVYFVSGEEFIWMSEKDGYMNLYLYNIEGDFIKQLTENRWVTKAIIGHDSEGNIYTSGTGKNPTETNIFKINIESGKQTQLTKNGTNKSSFSSDFKYRFNANSSIEVPNIESIYDSKNKIVKTLLEAENPYANISIGKAEYGTIKAADKKTSLHYRLIKPSNFDKSKKYPVLVYVYGGPHAQLVTNSWLGGASLWMHWMAQQGYLVFTVDGRGSAYRGFEFESIIHRNLGDHEMADQLAGVDFLKSLSYVDEKRLAVHGWSFGGFMTTSLLLRHPDVFTTGVAGGPVTDWKFYEIMYGERYMDRPSQNAEGYKKAALANYVKDLKGKLLLIHGTADDVVVMQHNLALVKAFIEEGIQMDFFPYPMHPHNVRGKDRVHLMTKVLQYIIENNK